MCHPFETKQKEQYITLIFPRQVLVGPSKQLQQMIQIEQLAGGKPVGYLQAHLCYNNVY